MPIEAPACVGLTIDNVRLKVHYGYYVGLRAHFFSDKVGLRWILVD